MINQTFLLEDQMDDNLPIEARVQVSERGILVGFEGYGELPTEPPDGFPVLIEFCEGRPRVVIWGDINQEDPTHVVSLDGARESLRK